jgi:hypothetical protein
MTGIRSEGAGEIRIYGGVNTHTAASNTHQPCLIQLIVFMLRLKVIVIQSG